VRARSNGIGSRSCCAIASCALRAAASTSPWAASHMLRQRAPTASFHGRSSLRPLRSSASINGSAWPLRPRAIIASTASGMNEAVMISVPGIASNVRCIGCTAARASAWFPKETSRNPMVIAGHWGQPR